MDDIDSGFSQVYGEAFAKVYNDRWVSFSDRMAPKLIELFRGDSQFGSSRRQIVDVCCGTGRLARNLIEAGYDVTGIDLSPHMLAHARANNEQAVHEGRARFLQADARDFRLESLVTFAVSLFDSMNHLPDTEGLQAAIACVFAALRSPGMFVFDMNTPRGLDRWNSITVEDSEELTIINRGIYAPGATRAYTSITGFIRNDHGLYERFSEQAYNTVFDIDVVPAMVTSAGFSECYVAKTGDLSRPVKDPNAEGRVFFVCHKA